MHDIKWIRDNPDAFDKGLGLRGLPPVAAKLLEADKEYRAVLGQVQEINAQRNEISKKIGEMKRAREDTAALEKQSVEAAARLTALKENEAHALAKVEEQLSAIPNIPAPDVQQGRDEKDNKEIRKVGEPPRKNNPKEHFDIGEKLGLMDFEGAARLSGSRFVVLKGQLARLERALANFMLDIHTTEFGYTEISPPLLVKTEAMFGTGQLPKFREEQFETTNGMWLIPTSEVSLTNLVRESILDAADLPLRFTAYTPCFRSEAGAAGKDTRGMIRMHQFAKVEMVSIVHPDKSKEEHERMTECAETILKRLGLAFRTVLLCTGDMGFSAQKTYDIEVWLPGQNVYREISSCSNCGDFQARRMQARFRTKGEKATQFVHTLNGSGVAVGRCLIAILENYQQDDGSVLIPEALRPYMNGAERIESPIKKLRNGCVGPIILAMLRKLPFCVFMILLAGLSACSGLNAPLQPHNSAASSTGAPGFSPGDRVAVRSGDTVYGIARRYDVPMRDLIAANNLQSPFQLKAGSTLILPNNKVTTQPGTGKLMVAEPTVISADEAVKPEKKPAPPPLEDGGKPGDVTYSQKAPETATETTHETTPGRKQKAFVVMESTGSKVMYAPEDAFPRPRPSEAKKIQTPPPPASKGKNDKDKLVNALNLQPLGYDKKKRQLKVLPPPPPNEELRSAEATSLQEEVRKEEEARPPEKRIEARMEKKKPPGSEDEEARQTRFTWPVQGPMLSTYGPKSNGLRNDGVNIGAPRGTPVVASDAGTVAYAGSDIPGFGNVVLVRHSSGLMTTYAHLDRMYVQRDSVVARGDMLGSVGTSGGLDTPQLHFEIRHGKEALDPAKYLYAR